MCHCRWTSIAQPTHPPHLHPENVAFTGKAFGLHVSARKRESSRNPSQKLQDTNKIQIDADVRKVLQPTRETHQKNKKQNGSKWQNAKKHEIQHQTAKTRAGIIPQNAATTNRMTSSACRRLLKSWNTCIFLVRKRWKKWKLANENIPLYIHTLHTVYLFQIACK